MNREAQGSWVARVLGFTPAMDWPASEHTRVDPRRLMGIWNGAKETVDDQISKLQVAFRDDGAAAAPAGAGWLRPRALTDDLPIAERTAASTR